jgi:hypothetical protein
MPVIIEVTPGTFLEIFTEISIEFELHGKIINILNLTFKSDLGAIVVNNNLSSNLSNNLFENISKNISNNIPKISRSAKGRRLVNLKE